MPVSDVLKGFRDKGYGDDKKKDDKEESSGPRMFKLTDDEVKELQGYSQGEGQEQQCLVTGRLSGSEFSVSSVHSPGGGMEEEPGLRPPPMPPVMQSQTMPSPS